MKGGFALVAVVVFSLTAWCQVPPNPGNAAQKQKKVSAFAEYAGDWASSFDGKIWLRLRLELQGERLAGSLSRPRNVQFNDSGEVKSVSDERVTESIADAALNPDGLMLTLKNPDTQETNRYMMRLVAPANDAADLKMIGMTMPPGMPKPKPWHVVRSAAAPTVESQTEPSLADYAGDWTSTFEGKLWLLLELKLQGNQLTGWFTHSRDLELNDEGGLKSVSEDKVKEKISVATLNAGGLVITVANAGPREPDQYLMRIVVPAKAADLAMLATDMPKYMPSPKAWVLLKFDAAAVKQPAPH
jgi:hypothetical protein